MQHPELGGGEPDPEGVVHQLAHAHDLLLEVLVEALDRQRGGAQHGIAELAHVTQRGVAAGARLGIELGWLGRVLLALDLDVVLLGARRRELERRVLCGCAVLCGHRL